MDDLATRRLLAPADLDALGRVMTNLLEEVIALSVRVDRLEGKGETEMQARIEAIIARVLSPL